MTEKLHVVLGSKALDILRDPGFQQDWNALYASCAWVDFEDRPEFLVPWYEVYNNFDPVVVYARGEQEQLVGLLPLCWHPDGDRLVRAGYEDGEYLSWICDQDHSVSFMPAALDAVRSKLGPVTVELGWLPPKVPLGWVRNRIGAGYRTRIETDRRFLIPVGDVEIVDRYIKSKKRLRTKWNKLARLGELSFRRYIETAELEMLFDYYFPLKSFRMAAAYGHAPISQQDEIRKRTLLLRLANAGYFHASALELDGVPIAAHMGIFIGKFLTLSGFVYLPHFGSMSPGQQLLLRLLQCLNEEGFESFDLSPGSEVYKERLGVEEQAVHYIFVYPSRKHYLLDKAKSGLKTWLKRHLPSNLIRQLRRSNAGSPIAIKSGDPPVVYRLGEEPKLAATGSSRLSRDCVPDLVSFSPDDMHEWVVFQRSAELLFQAGGMSLTACEGGNLKAAWFVVPAKNDFTLKGIGMPPDCWVLKLIPHGPIPDEFAIALCEVFNSIPEEMRRNLHAIADNSRHAAALKHAGFKLLEKQF